MLKELLIILTITYVGILIPAFFHFPLPGAIVGMFILFLLLVLKCVKIRQIEKVSDFILNNMILIFLPPAVKLVNYLSLLHEYFFRAIILILLTTIITMVVTGKTVNFLIEKKEKRNGIFK
jgi:holin-like protein